MSSQPRLTASPGSGLKILQVVQKPQRRGAEVAAFQLSAELRRQGCEVQTAYLYTCAEENPLPLLEGDRVLGPSSGHFLEKVLGLQPKVLRRLARQIREFRPDVVQLNGGRSVKYASFLRFLGSSPRVTIYRNIGQPDYWFRSWFAQVFYRHFAMPQVDGVVGVSRTTLDAVKTYHRLTRPSVYIPRGVDAEELTPKRSREAVRAETATPPEAAVAIYVGSLAPEKRLDRLLRVVGGLQQRALPTYLWLVGDGPLRAELEGQVGEAGLDERVRFLGVQADVATYLAAADVFLLASDTEGTPGVLLEAGLLGLPVVATRVGGVQECVLEGETGLLVDAADEEGFTEAVGALLDDAQKRQQMGRRASHWIDENFALWRVAERYIAFYREVLSHAPPKGARST